MPPKRRSKLVNMPKYVTVSNGRVVYRPYISAKDRAHIDTDKSGFLRPPVRLGKESDGEKKLLSAYLSARAAIESQIGETRHTLRWVVDKYMKSPKFQKLAKESQRRADSLIRVLDQSILIDGQSAKFGDVTISHISKPLVRSVANERLTQYQDAGRKGEAMVNREITFLSTSTKWATENIEGLNVIENPFRIEKFKEEANKRYVTDEEYFIQRDFSAGLYPYLPAFFDVTYCVASRGAESSDIYLKDIDPDRNTGGIDVHRTKGSDDNFIEWSDMLYSAYLEALKYHKTEKVSDINPPLFLNSRGGKLTRSALDSAMQRVKSAMQEAGLGHIFWNLHLLKSKGASDAEDERLTGLKSEAMRNRYNTKKRRHKPAR